MIFGTNTTRDISKLFQNSFTYNNFEMPLSIFMPLSSLIMLLPILILSVKKKEMVSIASKCRGRPELSGSAPFWTFFSRPCAILNVTAPVFQLWQKHLPLLSVTSANALTLKRKFLATPYIFHLFYYRKVRNTNKQQKHDKTCTDIENERSWINLG